MVVVGQKNGLCDIVILVVKMTRVFLCHGVVSLFAWRNIFQGSEEKVLKKKKGKENVSS